MTLQYYYKRVIIGAHKLFRGIQNKVTQNISYASTVQSIEAICSGNKVHGTIIEMKKSGCYIHTLNIYTTHNTLHNRGNQLKRATNKI